MRYHEHGFGCGVLRELRTGAARGRIIHKLEVKFPEGRKPPFPPNLIKPQIFQGSLRSLAATELLMARLDVLRLVEISPDLKLSGEERLPSYIDTSGTDPQ